MIERRTNRTSIDTLNAVCPYYTRDRRIGERRGLYRPTRDRRILNRFNG